MTTTLSVTEVTTLVRRLLRVKESGVLAWQQEPLEWLNIMDAQLFRVHGEANLFDGGPPRRWSFVLKTFTPPASDASSNSPTSWDYWKREVVAYLSPELDLLPGGLSTPRFTGLVEKPNGQLLLAIEEISDAITDRWDLDRYGRAARVFGRFNAAYLQGRAIPADEAFRPGGLRSWVDGLARIPDENPDFWQRPLVVRAIPQPDEARRLFEARHTLLDGLDRLPQTFTHRDLWPANVLVRRSEGAEEFVAIDWMLAGAGALGEDAAGLVGPTVWHFLIEPADLGAVEAVVVDGYLEGLDDGGWRGDAAMVRFGYAATLALRFGLLIPPWLASWLTADEQRAWAEQKFGRPIDAIADGWGELMRLLLDRGNQALRLASDLAMT
jgi:hypothetical protein